MRRGSLLLLILLGLGLGSCSWMPRLSFWGDDFEFPDTRLEVHELRRALLCGTPTEAPVVRLFDSAAELGAWDSDDRLQLDRIELPEERSFVLLEQGLRRTSGYSVELAKTARVTPDGTLHLEAEWLEPGEDRIVTQMLTSLCVLAAVPSMPYEAVEVKDADGVVRATREISRD